MNNKDIESKIAKLEALIASTRHKGERDAAILARDRLIKKLKGKHKYQKSYSKKEKQSKKKKSHTKEKRQKKHYQKQDNDNEESGEIDPFFLREDVCTREESDAFDATDRQKKFIFFLVQRGKLSCPEEALESFLNRIGLKQASRILDILLDMFGDPREEALSDNQYFFLVNRAELFGLSEEIIETLTSGEASKIITAIKIIEEKKTRNPSP